jgi:hypothetical protein
LFFRKNWKKIIIFKNSRYLEKKKPVFFFFLIKLIFSSNIFNNSYFKKTQTYTFQLSKREVMRDDFLRITSSFNQLHRHELIDLNILKKNNVQRLSNFFFFFNLFNSSDNFFFENFKTLFNYKKKLLKFSTVLFALYNILKNKKSDYGLFSVLITFLNFFSNLKKNSDNFNNFIFKDRLFQHFKINKKFNFLFNLFKQKFNLFFCNYFFNNSFFFKFFLLQYKWVVYATVDSSYFLYFIKNFFSSFFYSNSNKFFSNNLLPNINLHYVIKKKIMKIFNYDKFSSLIAPIYVDSLIKFFQFCSGKKILIKINNFLNLQLSYYEKIQCSGWANKVKIFRKMLGPRLFLSESLEILYLSFKLKDPFFLSHWLINMMKKISFWKYRLFFRYLKYALRFFFVPIFKDLNVKGIKFKLKGKISVAGNARTRTLLQRTGQTSHSNFSHKVLSQLSLVKTFTGVMGLKVWIFF